MFKRIKLNCFHAKRTKDLHAIYPRLRFSLARFVISRCVLRTRLTGYLLQHKQISVSWCVSPLYIREDQGMRDHQTGLRFRPSFETASKGENMAKSVASLSIFCLILTIVVAKPVPQQNSKFLTDRQSYCWKRFENESKKCDE